jgi:glyoxylase-like metal-dependent hydrolase (beta-lactamase superfamily II)
MRRAIVLAFLVLAGAASGAVVGGQQDPTAIHLQKIRDNLYVVLGGRGTGGQSNTVSGCTTVFVADSGVVLIDTKLPGFAYAILEQVKTITPKPVTTIINTHSHGDHTGGNTDFARTVEVVTHANTKANMARMEAFSDDDASFLPKRTFSDKLSLMSGRNRVDLYYFGRGHTSGDAVIVFPSHRIAVLGDLFARKWAPLVDAGNGGSAVEFPQTLARAVAGLKNVESVITGHSTRTIGSGAGARFEAFGPLVKWADLVEYADFTRELVAAAQAAMKAGRTVDQAVAEMKLPEKYKDYDMTNARNDVQRVYEESKSNP